jgi:hypothetical protein
MPTVAEGICHQHLYTVPGFAWQGVTPKRTSNYHHSSLQEKTGIIVCSLTAAHRHP